MKKLYIGNLSYNTTEDTIVAFLASVLPEGTDATTVITKVELIPGETTPNKGFGFAEIADDAIAETMIQQLDGQEVDGRPLRINEARPKTDRPRTGGGYNGGGASRGGYNGGGSSSSYGGGNRRSY